MQVTGGPRSWTGQSAGRPVPGIAHARHSATSPPQREGRRIDLRPSRRHRRNLGLRARTTMTNVPEPRRRALSLRVRLLLLVGLSAALVVGGTTYLQRRIVVSAVEEEALDTAGATALGVAAELTDRDVLPSSAEVDDMLGDFQRMVPAV